jgi:class 3 adenylate cyclase
MDDKISARHFGGLFNVLHQVAQMGREVALEVESLNAASLESDEADSVECHDLPSVAFDIEFAACVEPVTVMFADLRGFTALVEDYPPNQVVRQLNEYFSSMTRIIVEHGGILDKYMGDEIMAYFECHGPLEYSKAASRAVCAGIKMIKTLERLNQQWQLCGWPVLQSGVGINSGPVLKGNIGSIVKLETTIIGDTVNVASRLQQMNKDYGSRLLISGNTYKLLQGEFPVRSLGDLAIRGRRKTTVVYEIELQASARSSTAPIMTDPPSGAAGAPVETI